MGSRASIITRTSALVLALLMLAALAAPTSAGPRERRWTMAPGLERSWIRFARGPIVVRVLTIDLNRVDVRVGLAAERLPGFERTMAIGRRTGARAAINGDFARPIGRPVHTFARRQQLAQTELSWGRSFALGAGRRKVHIGRARTELYAHRPDLAVVTSLNRVNNGWPNDGQINQYTPAARRHEPPPEDACAVRLFPEAPARLRSDRVAVERRMVVDRRVCRKSRLFKAGGTVLATPRFGNRAPVIQSMSRGDEVVLGWSLRDPGPNGAYWEGVTETLGGNPTLVEDGRIVSQNVRGTGPFFHRHPRTGVGYDSRTHRLFLVVVDGRQPRYSVGMTPRRFARFFRAYLGADYALNLDGGGSSTMWVRGRGVINRPSDGRQRGVSSALLVFPGQPPREPSTGSGDGVTTTNRSATWRRIAADPASTGGLASFLDQKGYRLPAYMRDALRSVGGKNLEH
jgi:hypothetical protein